MRRGAWVATSLPAISVVAFLCLWQIAVAGLGIKDFILPGPIAILAALIQDRDELISNMGVTLIELGIGYAVGVTVGIVLAIAMTLLPWFRRAVYPLIVSSQSIPKIAIAPLLILWFGVGLLPKVLIVALLAFFPVLINAVVGIESADAGQLELMRSIDASSWKIYRYIRLPAAVPYLFAGLKLALTVSVIGVIVGEWVAGNAGLGYLLVAYNAALRTSDLFAALIVLVAISSICFLLISWIESRISWEARLHRNRPETGG